MTQIYVDMDGVVADFDAAILNIFGEPYGDRIQDQFWKQTCVQAEVFRQMPAISEGLDMVDALLEMDHSICFLTSTGGMPHHIDIAKQKLDWLHAHGLGEHPVAFCMNTKGKGRYAYRNARLIDDREKVCDEWIYQGGIALLFTRESAAQIAESLRPVF